MASPKPIHYGGSLTMRGRLSSRPKQGLSFRKKVLIEKLVRLDIGSGQAGQIGAVPVIPDKDIARMIGRSVRYLNQLRQSPDYLILRTEIMTGVSLTNSQNVREIEEYRKNYFRSMLPDCIRIIADNLERVPANNFERKLQVELAKDVLDREGTFPKISRTDVHAKVEHDYKETDLAAANLLNLLDSPVQSPESTTRMTTILEANTAFSTSDVIDENLKEAAIKKLEQIASEDSIDITKLN